MADEVGAESRRVFGSRSSLRHPCLAHVFNDPLASLQENWIVRLGAVSIAPEGESGIEGKPGLDLGSRFIESVIVESFAPSLSAPRQPASLRNLQG